MARQVDKKNSNYAERIKAGKQFYIFLLKLFLSAAIVCTAGLVYLWGWLAHYEAYSPQGAITAYFEKVTKQKFDEVYQDDISYFQELNSKDAVYAYLMEIYNGKNTSGLTYALDVSNGQYRSYAVYYDQVQICEIELVQPADNSKWKVRTINKNNQYGFDVFGDIDFSINNVNIPSSFTGTEQDAPTSYLDLGLDTKLDDVMHYSIGGFIWAPEIQLSDAADYMSVLDSTSNTVCIGPKPTSDQYTEFTTEIQDTAFAYAKYITKDGTYYELNKHLYPNTTFYKNMAGFDNQWFSSHNSIDFQNIEISNVMPLGQNAFIGSISFDYIISSSKVTKTYSSSYQLLFVKNSKNLWKLINLYILSSNETDGNQ